MIGLYRGTYGAILERENIFRGGQLLATDDSTTVAAPSALSGSISGSNIALSWTAVSGAGYYRVERKAAGGSFTLKDTTTTNSYSDTSVSSGTAYLYQVCTADSSGACLSAYSNVALGTTITFSTDPTIYTEAENPGNGTAVKHQHITELRTAVNAVRVLAGKSTITTPNPASGDPILASDVRTLRTKLGEALSALGIYNPTFTDPVLCGSAESCGTGTSIKKAHITELRSHCIGGSSCYKSISQFVTDAYQGVLHRAPSSGELSSGTATLTQAQALSPAQLISAAQTLLSTLFNSSEYTALGTSNAQFVTDLYEGYLQRAPDDSGYNYYLTRLNNSTDNRDQQRAAVSAPGEFQTNVASLCVAFGGSGGLQYVLSDLQGSARVAINNNGSSSAVVARHDYLPFGEEIGSGIGARTTGQGFGATDPNRWKYGLTERDATSGLDHALWRKYESLNGRWTSPDPYGGSITMGNPQSFNRYAYVQNDPVNFVDPTGLAPNDGPSDTWIVYIYSGYTPAENSLRAWARYANRRPLIPTGGTGGEPHGKGGAGGHETGPTGPQKPVPQPAPTPPGLPPYKDPEQPCIDGANEVRRDINNIARMVHGRTSGVLPSHRFPGLDIDPRGQSFGKVVNSLKKNGFVLDEVFGIQPLDHPEGENYKKQFNDGLWYHVIVKYPGDASGYIIRPDVDPRARTSRVTAHCHATDPSGADHLIDTIRP